MESMSSNRLQGMNQIDESVIDLETERNEYENYEGYATEFEQGGSQVDYDINCFENSSVINDAKGYCSFHKMTGRSVAFKNYMTNQPKPHEKRFLTLYGGTNIPKVKCIVPFEQRIGRNPITIKKVVNSNQMYNLNYDFVKKNAESLPSFNKLLGRTGGNNRGRIPFKKANFCINEQDLLKRDFDVIYPREKHPDFSRMYGRSLNNAFV